MSQNKKQAPPLDTAAGLLLTLTALSGEFPISLVSRLPGGEAYKAKVIKRLKKDGFLRTYYADKLRGLRLTTAAKRCLLDEWPEQFCPYLSGCTETNMPKSELTRRLRLHRMAEVLVTMYNAGVGALPWQKHDIFNSTPHNDVQIDWPMYYSSREVKEIGRQRDKISGSRCTGILLTESDVFTVYNTGASEMKWEYSYESHLHVFLKFDLRHQILPNQYADTEVSAVIFGANMDQMSVLMGISGDKRHKYFVLDGGYDHFYYLTSDRRGGLILQMLCDPEKKAVLDNILMEGYAESRTWRIENDAMDGGTPVLFGYTCDMPRIKRFANGLKIHGPTGMLYCFDFQEDALKQICGPNVEIQCMDFKAIERLL